jgi:NhaA family Na+:H+ antiporter
MPGRTIDSDVKTPERRPVALLTRPLSLFASARASSGMVLLAAAAAALLWANSPWWRSYDQLWEFRIGFGFQGLEVFRPLLFWMNDGLMTVFFLLVGLEIKREVSTGELASFRRAALPIAAALGGVLVPALIYTGFNAGRAGHAGWGIPMATDIAFVSGVMALLGSRIPSGLAVFLTALAIVDDLFAVVVIAVFYTGSIHWIALVAAGGLLLLLLLMNRLGVAEPLAYALPGALLWVSVLNSGVHATIAGVLLAIAIPGRRFLDPVEFLKRGTTLMNEFAVALEESATGEENREEIVEKLESACRHAEPPLHRMEQALRPWVAMAIMPLFAFANAGVRFVDGTQRGLGNAITVGVLLGLFLGKPAGIMLFSFLSARVRLAERPLGVSWRHIHGAAWLAGIGFTMSLFVAGLAFGPSPLLNDAKLGIFAASILAGITGSILLLRVRSTR